MDTCKDNRRRKNPEESSNFLSRLLFGWSAPIFWKGGRHELQVTDLYDPLKSDESEYLGDLLEREWKAELTRTEQDSKLMKNSNEKSTRQPSLIWAITRIFWAPYMLQGLLLLIQATVLHVCQPVLQEWIIGYFNPEENLTTRDQVLLYAGCLVLVTVGVVFVTHHTTLRTQQIGMRIRIACCSLLYRKVLRLDQSVIANNTAAGRVANLISNDVARFDTIPVFFHHIWIMPIQVSLIGYVMWRSVGIAALVGIGSIMMQTIPIQGYLSHLSAKLRSKIANQTDERVQLMSELISGIQVVKMYSWEKRFEQIVSKVRALEIKFIGYTSYLRGFYLSIMAFSERVSLYLTLITFVLMGNSLTAEITFVLATLVSILQYTCSICFPQAIVMAGETAVSLKRLTKFLLLDEIGSQDNVKSIDANEIQNMNGLIASKQITYGVGIEMVEVAANWVDGQSPPTLSNVSLKINSRSLCAFVGPVGSGKSSLLYMILGELSAKAGRLTLFTDENGAETVSSSPDLSGKNNNNVTRREIRISYASQDPWLFSASIRDNILFGQPYDKNRYHEVTRVCSLLKDFEQLSQGDSSFVGERGAALSGGQRARVNLARAVYRDADLYLLDDPLSAVDPQVGRHLFEECIKGFLKEKTCILVTHQLQYLRQTDTIVIFNHGTVERQGTYEELVESNFPISVSEKFDEIDVIEQTGKSREDQTYRESLSLTVENNKLSDDIENTEITEEMSEEEMAKGKMSNKVYWGYFLAGGNLCSLSFLVGVFVIGQLAVSGTDYWVTFWTNQETLKISFELNKSLNDNISYYNGTNRYYENTYFVRSQWFDEFGLILPNLAICIYTVCVIGCIVFTTLRSMLFIRICMNASRNIHDSMFGNLLQTTMRFFNINPSGRILNRFSKDMGGMDELLPRVMLEALQIFTILLGILTIVALVNYWMFLPTIAIGGIFYAIRTYYLKTAQKIKRLEGITKSPLFSHISSTLEGLVTIRSRGAPVKELLRREFDHYQDAHTSAWYLTITASNAFGFVLDLISCVFIAGVCFSIILMDNGETLPGSVGLAISQSLILTGLVQYGIRQSTEVISQMTSVERVLQYTNLPKEGPFTTDKPPPAAWPSKGGLTFENVSMKYAENKQLVLKNLNLTINPGWKVGIVGRTGAGKSSLISALFRLTGEGLQGKIVLDGIDTQSIGLHELRPCISIIPQEPILFSASLRKNLDPFEQYSDAELWESLREVELGDAVSSLGSSVAGNGVNFSVGQRQLICLARALLRKNKLLVLDEATANVDRRTDALIQKTIRQRFANCTVLTIAHRLNTIMDSDRILVMDEGQIVEFGKPYLLLKNQEGHFSKMVGELGKSMAGKLTSIAETSYLLSLESDIEPENSTNL